MFMGCSLTRVNALWSIIFHINYLYSTTLCPFSDKLFISCFYEAPPSEIRTWLGAPECCDWLNRL